MRLPARNYEGATNRKGWLAMESATAQALLLAAADAVIGFDLEGRVTSWNPAAEQLLLWPAAQAFGHQAGELFNVEPPADAMAAFTAVTHGRTVRADYWIRRHGRKDGSTVWTHVSWRPNRGADGVVRGVTFVASDVSQQRVTSMELERLEWQDTLTLLPNRHALLMHLRELAAAPASGTQVG